MTRTEDFWRGTYRMSRAEPCLHGATLGTTPKPLTQLKLNEKGSLLRGSLKHKPNTKEAQAEEIRDLWTKIDEEEVEKEGAESGKAERMSRDELQKHIQGKSRRQTKE